MLLVRSATMDDFQKIAAIYRFAQDFMIKSGNPTQWGRTYPSAELIKSDINQNACKVIFDDNGIHGVFALFDVEEPTYKQIDGSWLNDEPYVTIHRLAGDGQTHGLFQCAANYAKTVSRNVRLDTHADNLIMQSLIQKYGFTPLRHHLRRRRLSPPCLPPISPIIPAHITMNVYSASVLTILSLAP